MKKTAAAMTVLGVLLCLTACSSSPEDAYVSAVREDTPEVLRGGSEEELVELGEVICERLDDGTSPYDISEDFLDLGWSMATAGTVVVQAAKHLCPEHADAVD